MAPFSHKQFHKHLNYNLQNQTKRLTFFLLQFSIFQHIFDEFQMTWKMKVEEIECVLEKIWDLHDKLSDAIHSISRTHFLRSVNSSSLRTNSDDNRTGFVFVKGFPVNDSAIRDAKSLNSIRTALENLQDQLEFVHVCLLSFDFV